MKPAIKYYLLTKNNCLHRRQAPLITALRFIGINLSISGPLWFLGFLIISCLIFMHAIKRCRTKLEGNSFGTFSHEPVMYDGSRFWLLACERVTAKNSLGKEQYRDRNSEKQHKTLNGDFRLFAYLWVSLIILPI